MTSWPVTLRLRPAAGPIVVTLSQADVERMRDDPRTPPRQVRCCERALRGDRVALRTCAYIISAAAAACRTGERLTMRRYVLAMRLAMRGTAHWTAYDDGHAVAGGGVTYTASGPAIWTHFGGAPGRRGAQAIMRALDRLLPPECCPVCGGVPDSDHHDLCFYSGRVGGGGRRRKDAIRRALFERRLTLRSGISSTQHRARLRATILAEIARYRARREAA